MHWIRTGLATFAAVLALACLVLAQTPSPPPAPPGPPVRQVESGPQLMPPPESAAKPAPRLPQVVLRGRVLNKDRPPMALLEIEGALHLVGPGSALAGQGSIMMRVVEINQNEVRIQVEPFNEVIMLR